MSHYEVPLLEERIRSTQMIELRADSLEIPLGETLVLQIDAGEEGVETRLLVRHEGVLYTRPWRDWARPAS